jgi:hypothetical protein
MQQYTRYTRIGARHAPSRYVTAEAIAVRTGTDWALMALLRGEPGAEMVASALGMVTAPGAKSRAPEAVISAINLRIPAKANSIPEGSRRAPCLFSCIATEYT